MCVCGSVTPAAYQCIDVATSGGNATFRKGDEGEAAHHGEDIDYVSAYLSEA